MIGSVYLVCGVSGSGKSWVCEQVADRMLYVPHDFYMHGDIVAAIVHAFQSPKLDRPVITDCPFGERELRARLALAGFAVYPYFVVEPTHVVASRYLAREGKALSKAALTRTTTIANRAREWKAPYGSSEEILMLLQSVAV